MKSMTGYGSAEGRVGKGNVFVEIKSVNHRYCDLQLKIPPKMNRLDPQLRGLVRSKLERGKVELFLKERRGIAEGKDLSLDLSLAKKYHKCLKDLERQLGFKMNNVHLLELIDARELISIEDVGVDYSKYWSVIRRLANIALNKMDQMRAKEGAYLLKDQRKRLKKVLSIVSSISKLSKVAMKKHKQKLQVKASKNNDRFEPEFSAQLDKIDISEEITRLGSHIKQYGHIIGKKGAIGRQLDFILQEMNREINTIGSKACDAKIASSVITIKSELEKLREQVQNIE